MSHKKLSFIISFLFLFSSLIFFFFIYVKSINNQSYSNYYIKYYVINIFFFIFSIISFWIKKEFKFKITIILISVLISFYIIEIFLTIKDHKVRKNEIQNITRNKIIDEKNLEKKKILYKSKTGKNFDTRSRIDVLINLENQGENIAPVVPPGEYLDDKNLKIYPLSGVSNIKTIHCNENGYFSFYNSDRYGFNNSNHEWKKNKISYLFLGDSFTHGSCVFREDTISGNLRSQIDEKNGIINLGYSGNGPLIEYGTLKEYIDINKVERIIWIYYERNDLGDLKNRLESQILRKYLLDKNFKQNLKFKQSQIDKIAKEKIKISRNNIGKNLILSDRNKENNYNKIRRYLFLTNLRIFTLEKIFNKKIPFDEFRTILEKTKNLATENNAKFYFVYLPSSNRYIDNNNQKPNFYQKKTVLKIIDDLNINSIDMVELLFNKMQKNNIDINKVVYPFGMTDSHFNSTGYRLISEKIYQEIKKIEKNN
ncbi:hypothetical protein IDH14_03980 [Pelagibacterales bacterium SAG-MED33]|nr:hypothetical protein [Pelagibacterales bacterium SAG-MED33]